MPDLSVAVAHLRQEADASKRRGGSVSPQTLRREGLFDAVAALLEAIAEKPTLSVAQIQAGWRLNLQPYLDDVAAAAGAVAAVVVPEEVPRALTVMESHLATECPDRDNCWAADVHDKYHPRPAAVVPTTEEKPMSEKSWRLDFICCGYDDGSQVLADEVAAKSFRESYTAAEGHDRQAVLSRTNEEPRGWRNGPTGVPPFLDYRNPWSEEEVAEQLAIRSAALSVASEVDPDA